MPSVVSLSDKDRKALADLCEQLAQQSTTYLGYPNNQLLNNAELTPFLNMVINNIGDPFVGNHGIHTCEFEKQVLSFFRQLFQIDENEYWGYVCRGGTEGNIFGLNLAREIYPNGIVYHSSNSHYSVRKAIKLLRVDSCVITSTRNGEIDYADLEEQIAKNRDRPVIMLANIGSTMKGAIDSIDQIVEIFEKLQINEFYIHCDAALFGVMLPFIEGAPELSFRCPVNSISVSGHKFLGSPIPCGVVLTRKKLIRNISGHVDYIGSYDSTIFGSRDGFSVLLLWMQIKRVGVEGLRQWVKDCMSLADYTLEQLAQIEWPAWKNDFSNIIMIRRPVEFVCKKWHLATEADQAHIIIMPSVEKTNIDAFIEDLKAYNKY